MWFKRQFFIVIPVLFLTACAVRPGPHAPAPAAVPVSPSAQQPPLPVPLPPPSALFRVSPEASPDFNDDADTASLRSAALQSQRYYQSRPPEEVYTLASDTYTARDLADSMGSFISLLDNAKSPEEWKAAVRKDFQTYQSVGTDANHTVTFSSYYEPSIPARLHRTQEYRYPIYGRPQDLIDVDLGLFNKAYQGSRISGRRQGNKLVPYYTRADIDSRKILKGQRLVIAWARDPLDIFFMQVEGTGWLRVGKNKQVRIRYDGDNGRRYRSVGLYLLNSGKIPTKQLSHDQFQRYMSDHPKERQGYLNYDERYIFFRIDRSTASVYAYGNLEVPLTPGRSIATDPKLFPKSMMAWISTQQPVFDDQGVEVSSAPLNRFMFSQDEGGAIQGPGRVDYFAGNGPAAERFATHFWVKGTLYFLVKKKPI